MGYSIRLTEQENEKLLNIARRLGLKRAQVLRRLIASAEVRENVPFQYLTVEELEDAVAILTSKLKLARGETRLYSHDEVWAEVDKENA